MMVILSSTGQLVSEHWKRLRNALPNFDILRNWRFGSTTSAFPGITWSVSPFITAMNRSVVGSGPTLIPGNSCSNRYLIKVVLPVEYWPTRRIIGLAVKSASSRDGEWNSLKRYSSSRGKITFLYISLSPSKTLLKTCGCLRRPSSLFSQVNMMNEFK